MNKLTEKVFETVPYGHFTSHDLAVLFPGSDDQKYGLVKRAIRNGEIIHIRRGLYCLAPKYQKKNVNPYALAQSIYGPSYISLESSLQWHGWIPEAVHTITSASFHKAKEFQTPLGIFSYERVPQKVFYTEVNRVQDESGNISLMASPIKALADYVYARRKDWRGLEPVVGSLRIEPDEFRLVTNEAIQRLIDNYSQVRVKRFLEGMREDLKL